MFMRAGGHPWRSIAALAGWAAVSAPAPAVQPGFPPGIYEGHQTEIAAGLELRADGRFRYGLSYGALDEQAEGRWITEGGAVLLTSDPVTPPRFVLLSQNSGPAGQLKLTLDLPAGLSRQYFEAEVSGGRTPPAEHQLSDMEQPDTIALSGDATAVALLLPMFDLRSEPVPLQGKAGHTLRFRFDPNDLGKASFARTALRIEGRDLVLQRHDRAIRFRRRSGMPER